MKRSALGIYVFAAALVAGAIPVAAQDSRPSSGSSSGQAGSRPSGGGEATGTAVSRPSGGGGGSSSGSGGGGGSMGSSSSAGSAASRGGSGASMPSGGGDFSVSRPSAPERRSGDYAVPRAGSENGFLGRTAASRVPSSPGDAANDRRAVPAYSRPRDGRNATGEAIDRRDLPVRGGGGTTIINPWYSYWDPFYGPSRYGYYGYYGPWMGGYGFGLGYFYDPWGYSYYSPYNYDYEYGYAGAGRYSYNRGYRPVGNLRLKVAPRDGQVYVDGYYAGEVDSFDGVFQRLALEAGPHKVEIRAEGYEPVTFEVMVTAGETVTYKGELKRR